MEWGIDFGVPPPPPSHPPGLVWWLVSEVAFSPPPPSLFVYAPEAMAMCPAIQYIAFYVTLLSSCPLCSAQIHPPIPFQSLFLHIFDSFCLSSTSTFPPFVDGSTNTHELKGHRYRVISESFSGGCEWDICAIWGSLHPGTRPFRVDRKSRKSLIFAPPPPPRQPPLQ